MPILIENHVYEAMLKSSRMAMPLEACGLCGGREGRITRFYELTNADASGEHYNMLPEEQFAAVKDMRKRNLAMLAIWHSHPATPARMSQEDLRLAFTPGVVYLIVSLAAATPVVRGFTVADGRSTPADVEVVDNSDMDGGENA